MFISVVGADRVPVESRVDRAMFGYYASKRAAERVVAASGLPWTTLRATQFHDLMLHDRAADDEAARRPGPVGLRFQPVDTDEVADRLAELALGPPAGLVRRPRPARGSTSCATSSAATCGRGGKHRALVGMRPPGRAGRALRAGANLAPDRAVGRRTWEEFLAARVAA